MQRYVAAIHKAVKYVYLSHWEFCATPLQVKGSDAEQQAREDYLAMVAQLSLTAAMEGTAIRAVLTDLSDDTVLEAQLYSGEKVRYYLAAYQQGDRYWIDQILADVNHYEAMWPSEGITTMAIASTLDELEYQLGEAYSRYELLV